LTEYVPHHPLKTLAAQKIYFGSFRPATKELPMGKGLIREVYHDAQGVCFTSDHRGIKMIQGFLDGRPESNEYYILNIKENLLRAIQCYDSDHHSGVLWEMMRDGYDDFRLSINTEKTSLSESRARQIFHHIEQYLVKLTLAYSYPAPQATPNDTTDPTPLIQLITMITLPNGDKGYLVSGTVDDQNRLQGNVILNGIEREEIPPYVANIEGTFENDHFIFGTIAETKGSLSTNIVGRFNEHFFDGTITLIESSVQKRIFEGKFPRSLDPFNLSIDLMDSRKLKDIYYKIMLRSSNHSSFDRLQYEYKGEIVKCNPHGKGIKAIWSVQQTFFLYVDGRFINGEVSSGDLEQATIGLERTPKAPETLITILDPSLPSLYHLCDLTIKNSLFLSVSATTHLLKSDEKQVLWTITRSLNGSMEYQNKIKRETRPALAEEVALFQHVENNALTLTSLIVQFTPKSNKSSSASCPSATTANHTPVDTSESLRQALLAEEADQERSRKAAKALKQEQDAQRCIALEKQKQQKLQEKNARQKAALEAQQLLVQQDQERRAQQRIAAQERAAREKAQKESAQKERLLQQQLLATQRGEARQLKAQREAEERAEREREHLLNSKKQVFLEEKCTSSTPLSLNVAEETPTKISAGTQTMLSYPPEPDDLSSLEVAIGARYLPDDHFSTANAPGVILEDILKGLAREEGDWFFKYTLQEDSKNQHHVRKWIQSRGASQVHMHFSLNFIMYLQVETDSFDSYVLISVFSDAPLLKNSSFHGSAIVAIIQKNSQCFEEAFIYEGEFICTENFHDAIAVDLNFELQHGQRSHIDCSQNTVTVLSGHFKDDTLITENPNAPKCVYDLTYWEQINHYCLQPKALITQNPYGFYNGRPSTEPPSHSPLPQHKV